MTVVKDQLFPQKTPGSRFRLSRTRVQPSPAIELPSAFAESGAYPPDKELPGSPRQCSLPLACRHPPEGHQIGARKRRTPEDTTPSQPYCRRVSTDRPNRESSQLAASLEGEPGPTPSGKTLPQSYPETRFWRERARGCSSERLRVLTVLLETTSAISLFSLLLHPQVCCEQYTSIYCRFLIVWRVRRTFFPSELCFLPCNHWLDFRHQLMWNFKNIKYIYIYICTILLFKASSERA